MKNIRFKIIATLLTFVLQLSFVAESTNFITISKATLADKIKGGWAGQVIGCSYGGHTEFKYNGVMIPDSIIVPWDSNQCYLYFTTDPGLYDDVYMDLTFVDVFEKEGLNASARSHAKAYAEADYILWHANQAGRYNVLNGILPPKSGHWENNPHADDIDFQIEADFAGLMSPGMVNAATKICDKIGHIMNYGDGWYGGVYVASMYSLSFISNDVNYVVEEALKSIPVKSDFYQCMNDVIRWHKKYPDNWRKTWQEVQQKWGNAEKCPDGIDADFNIDAKINAAYIIIGLLYGNGDYGRTLDIATRCGQDSDCNPASAGGILGSIIGFSNLPDYWQKTVQPVEDIDFKFTTVSLKKVYELSTKHATEMLKRNGAIISENTIEIPVRKIKPVRYEKSFAGHKVVEKRRIHKALDETLNTLSLNFEGKGFVLTGGIENAEHLTNQKVLQLEITLDNNKPEIINLPSDFRKRRFDIAWKYNLRNIQHSIKLRLLNPDNAFKLNVRELVVYSAD